jgi:hypothetical protein
VSVRQESGARSQETREGSGRYSGWTTRGVWGSANRRNSRDQTGSRSVAETLSLLFVCFASLVFADETDRPSSFATRLNALAVKCDELGLKEQAAITRGWSIARHAGRQYFFLPAGSDSTAPKSGAGETFSQWHRKFLELRRERATELFAQAIAASGAGQDDKAYQLLFEVLHEDSDHAEARRVLGYVKTGSDWRLSGEEKATPRQPAFDHPKTGWRARGWWSLETPHFQIASNDQRELKEAAEQLENLDAIWRQVFFSYWSTPGALAARLAGGNQLLSPPKPAKMQVVLFKTQQEYIAYVAGSHQKAASTLGIYDDKQRVSHFFAGDRSVYPTWYHEATHQLFREAIANTRDDAGAERDFWALEGVALYMESLAEHNGYWTVGGWDSDRLHFARYRVLSGDLKLPLAQISSLSRDAIQNSDDIGRIYSQAAGLAHFLIDGGGGKYRAAMIGLLADVYRGRNEDGRFLANATGVALPQLDEEYRAFLNVTDDDLVGTPDPARLKNVALCRTGVSDAGFGRLAGCKNLQWLDLSFTAASDEGLKVFEKNSGLKQLFLEGSKITPASLQVIAGFKQMKELDLSRLSIHDEDLAALVSLRLLKTLHLTGCPISDAGLQHLRGLKQLEQLECSETKVTEEGIRKLKTAIPKLKTE